MVYKKIGNLLASTKWFLLTLALSSYADIVTFTGGTVQMADGSTATTDGATLFGNVSYYEEGDFYLQYNSPSPFGQYVGTYYGQGNDVIHGHWDDGLESIEISRTDNQQFTLRYFSLTSNTEIGGGPATGNENIFIEGYAGGASITDSYRIPSDDWGGSFNDVFLPDSFLGVDKVVISGEGAYCFGMDSFAFNDANLETLVTGNEVELIPTVPEPATVGFVGIGAAALFLIKRKGVKNGNY